MQNPFTMTLPGQGNSREYGNANDSFDFPGTLEFEDTNEPVLTGAGGGVATYRGNQSEQFQSDNPAYAGEYHLGYENAIGLPAPVAQSTAPAPGSTDLVVARTTGGVAGTNRIIQSDGPVTGRDNPFSGLQGDLFTPNPNYNGPVSGGQDYSQQLANAYFASQATLFSEQASAQALISAV